MKILLIMRHAKSDWGDADLSDHDRPLNHRGRRDAPRMGRFLASKGLHPEAVLSSSALRARTTVDAVVEAAQWDVSVDIVEEFYLASPRDIIAHLETLANSVECALIMAHNPGVANLVSALTGTHVEMPTAAVAEVQLNIESWLELGLDPLHRLENHWHPKGLPADFA